MQCTAYSQLTGLAHCVRGPAPENSKGAAWKSGDAPLVWKSQAEIDDRAIPGRLFEPSMLTVDHIYSASRRII